VLALGEAGQTNAPAGVSAQDVWVRRALLQRLVRLYEQQLSNLAELENAKGRREEVARAAQAWTQFTEFGDSTLSFELRFWVDVFQANAAQVSSDLRLMIAGAFAENGIVIDFPQRDIHLHAARPIRVEVVPRTNPQDGAGATPTRGGFESKPDSTR
jgi:small-conductance mechanosensitive channel